MLKFLQACVIVSVIQLVVCIGANDRSKTNRKDAIIFPEEVRPSELNLPYHHHHHHHHSSPDFHTPQFHGVEEPPKSIDEEYIPRPSEGFYEIPVEYIQNLNLNNVTDLLLNYIDGYEEKATVQVSDRFGETEDIERNAAIMAKPAGCIPEVRAVQIIENKDPSVFYIPQCTRIERCGGCCSHRLLSCQPSEIDTVTLQVIKTAYQGKKKLQYLGKELVQLEKHTKCKCDCIVKESDCNLYQEYREKECKCVCKNIDEEKKCFKKNSTKLWDPSLCACICREVLSCSTGSQFDQNHCKCVPMTMKRRYLAGYLYSDDEFEN